MQQEAQNPQRNPNIFSKYVVSKETLSLSEFSKKLSWYIVPLFQQSPQSKPNEFPNKNKLTLYMLSQFQQNIIFFDI